MIAEAWIAATLVALPTSGIQVRGDAGCPTSGAVEAALLGLLPAGVAAPPDVVDLVAQGKSVSVRLSSAAQELIGEKQLPESLTCAERARTAAVMVAAWELRLRGVTSPLGPLPAPPPVATAVNKDPAAGAAQRAASAPVTTVSRAPTPGPPALSAPQPIRLEASAAGLLSIAPDGASPAMTLAISARRGGSPRAVGLGVLAVGSHATEVASGRGTWRRIGGWFDLRSSTRWPAVEAQLRAGLALTALSLRGEAFPVTRTFWLLDPGVLAGASIGFFPGRRMSPTLEMTAAAWPRAHGLQVDGSPFSTQLPSFEALLGLGLTLRGPL